jgi:hypothetical protein
MNLYLLLTKYNYLYLI